jgi:hypothetical protein
MLTNGVWMQSTTAGSGNQTLVAYQNFVTFAAAYPVDGTTNKSQNFFYSILDNSNPPNPIEWGIGYLSASTTLVRQVVLGTWVSNTLTTNAPTAVTLSAGTYNIVNALPMGGAMAGYTGQNSTVGSSSGYWYPYPWEMPFSAGVFNTLVANTCYFAPFLMHSCRQISSIGMRVSVGVTGNGRMGIYTCTEAGVPGNKLQESGDISLASTGVITFTLGSPLIMPPDWYYFAFATKGITPNMNALNSQSQAIGTPCNTDATRVQALVAVTQALGAGWVNLPDPAAPTATVASTNLFPAFSFKQ